jgi:hypothetical protein
MAKPQRTPQSAAPGHKKPSRPKKVRLPNDADGLTILALLARMAPTPEPPSPEEATDD